MKKRRAISLIETLISLTILGIALVALMPTITVRQDGGDLGMGNRFWDDKGNFYTSTQDVFVGSINNLPNDLSTLAKFKLYNKAFYNSALMPLRVLDALHWNGQIISAPAGYIHFMGGATGKASNALTAYSRNIFTDKNRVFIDNSDTINSIDGFRFRPDLNKSALRDSTQYYSLNNQGNEYLSVDVTNSAVGIGKNATRLMAVGQIVSILNAPDTFKYDPGAINPKGGLVLAIGLRKAGATGYSTRSNFAVTSTGSSGELVFYSNVNANSYRANSLIKSSDLRLKNLIGSYEKGLAYICKINPKTFTFKDDKEQKVQVGVIAQELRKVLPEAVQTNSDTGHLMVSVDPVFYGLINAIKELNAKNLEIENENKLLEEKVIKLRAIRDRMKASDGGNDV